FNAREIAAILPLGGELGASRLDFVGNGTRLRQPRRAVLLGSSALFPHCLTELGQEARTQFPGACADCKSVGSTTVLRLAQRRLAECARVSQLLAQMRQLLA